MGQGPVSALCPGQHPSQWIDSVPVKAAAKYDRVDCVQLHIEEGFNICHPENTETDYSIPICVATEYRSMASFDVLFRAHSKQGSMSIAFATPF